MSQSRTSARRIAPLAALFPDQRANDVRLAWILGPLSLGCLCVAIVVASLGGSIAVFGTLAFTSVSIGLAIVTIRMATLTGSYAPLHRKRALPVIRSQPPLDHDIGEPAPMPVEAADAGTREWTPQVLAEISAERFEAVCITYFRRLGFRATTRPTGRGHGIDIRLHLNGPNHAPVNLVRCAATEQPIGVNDIREFIAAMNRHRVPRGIYVSARGFRTSARGLAEVNRIFVMSAEELVAKILERPPEEQAELLALALDGEEAIAA